VGAKKKRKTKKKEKKFFFLTRGSLLASSFFAAFHDTDVTVVEATFGDTAGLSSAWCKLLAVRLRDIWDAGAEPGRNSSLCMTVLDHNSSIVQALQLCARHEANVFAVVESEVCSDLIHFLEACLEAPEGLLERGGAVVTLGLFETLLACEAWCDALAGSPLLFLLFTLPVREALPHNAPFRLKCAHLVRSSVVNWSPAVMASMHDADWIGFVLPRIDSDFGTVSGECVVVVAETVVKVLARNAGLDGLILKSFSGSGVVLFFFCFFF
jgi:hypothetical protein